MIVNEIMCFLQNYSAHPKDTLKEALAACSTNLLTEAADDLFLQVSKHDDALISAYQADSSKCEEAANGIAAYIVDKFVMANRRGIPLPKYVASKLDKVPKMPGESTGTTNFVKNSPRAQNDLSDLSTIELESFPRQVDNLRKSVIQLRADTDTNNRSIDRMKIEINSHSTTLADFRGRLEKCEVDSSALRNRGSDGGDVMTGSGYDYGTSEASRGPGSRFRDRYSYKNPGGGGRDWGGSGSGDEGDSAPRRPRSSLGFSSYTSDYSPSNYSSSSYSSSSYRPRTASGSGFGGSGGGSYPTYQSTSRSRYGGGGGGYRTSGSLSGIGSSSGSGGYRSRRLSWSSMR